ncbi:hypothetical protein ACWEKM_09110 [Streptomyces sp. NPDC004752]
MTALGDLTADDAADLKEIRTSYPELDAVTHHVRNFATMMGDLRACSTNSRRTERFPSSASAHHP